MRRFGWVAMGLAACGGGIDEDTRVDTILDLEGDAVAGEAVYRDECATCHGLAGEGGIGPAMADAADLDEAALVTVVLDGVGDSMPPCDTLPDQDIADLVAFVLTF